MAMHNKIDWPVEDMRRWYEEDGLSVTQIAKRLDRNPKLVWKVTKKHGFDMRPVGCPGGERHPCWEGGRRIDKDGYVLIWKPDHPHARNNGTVLEHRLVAEEKLGRYLTEEEVVHHKNKDKQDNRPANLEVFDTNASHLEHELTGNIPSWTPEGKDRIAQAVTRKRGPNEQMSQFASNRPRDENGQFKTI